ncbi:chitinase, partial [Enterococcus faecium]
ARSDRLNIRTQEATALPAPSIPNGLSINHVTQSTVRLVWQENSLLEEVLYYEIYRDGKKIATSQTAVFEDQN